MSTPLSTILPVTFGFPLHPDALRDIVANVASLAPTYDASQGTTPELIAALSSADMAVFIVGGDHLKGVAAEMFDYVTTNPSERIGAAFLLVDSEESAPLFQKLREAGLAVARLEDRSRALEVVHSTLGAIQTRHLPPISAFGARLQKLYDDDAPPVTPQAPRETRPEADNEITREADPAEDLETGQISFSEIQESDFTVGAWAVIQVARRIGTSRRRAEICSASRLLAALVLWGSGDQPAQHIGRWLCQQLKQSPNATYQVLRQRYPAVGLAEGSFHAILVSEDPPAQSMSPALKRILDLARRLAIETRPRASDRAIAARHLLGAALIRADGFATVDRFLRSLNANSSDLRAKFLEDLPSWSVDDDPEIFRRLIDPVTSTPEEPGVPSFIADSAVGPDLIGITREVEAMASLVAAWSVEPPLSIGLFGEWGSGKSFFMQKMKDRVSQIAAAARKSGKGQQEFGYYKNIVQVEFNAWHYVEGNLWASLVEHIFSNLRLDLPGEENIDTEDNIRRRLEKLLGELRDRTTDAQQKEAASVEASKAAEAKKQEAETKAKALDEAAADALTEAAKLEAEERTAAEAAADRQREADASLMERRNLSLRDILTEVTSSDKIREAARKDLALLGITEDRIKTVHGLQDSLREAAGAGKVVQEGIKILKEDKGRWRLLLWVVAAPLVTFSAVKLTGYLGGWSASSWLQSLNGSLSAAATLIGAAVAGWKRYLPKLKPVLDAVERIKDKQVELERDVEKAREARAQQAAKLDQEALSKRAAAELQQTVARKKSAESAAARREAEEKAKAAERAEAEAQKARDELARVQAEVDALAPQRRIATFIQDRAKATDYRQHLGVPALIRRDFEKLSAMFLTQRKAEVANQDGTQAPGRNDLAIVNRIVLYIDDLDRCPPHKVVEVLRAIHLLLAFPLFVVVVAVDARWMKRSLRDRFSLMLNAEPAATLDPGEPKPVAGVSPMATADDYLEKIFQVPFWIRPLGRSACRNLVLALTKNDVESTAPDTPPPPSPNPGAPAVVPPPAPAVASTTPAPAVAPVAAPAGGGPATPPPVTPSPVAAGAEQPFPWSQIEPRPRSLFLTKEERDYMGELATLIGRSPRSVKRFVNCYRLLKSAVDPDELARVSRDGTFRSTMILLGVVTGAPDLAPALLEHLRQSEPSLTPIAWTHRAEKDLNLSRYTCWSFLGRAIEQMKGISNIRPLIEAAGFVDRFSFSPTRHPTPKAVVPAAVSQQESIS